MAERLRKQLALCTHTLGGTIITKTASFGVASFDGVTEVFGPEVLLQRVDQALYRAKQSGRNRVVLWTPSAV